MTIIGSMIVALLLFVYGLYWVMPKIYMYNGFQFYFYSKEHEPPHCHVAKAGVKAKIHLSNIGVAILGDLEYNTRQEFNPTEEEKIYDFVRAYGRGIIKKWHICFTDKKKPRCEKIKSIKKVRAA